MSATKRSSGASWIVRAWFVVTIQCLLVLLFNSQDVLAQNCQTKPVAPSATFTLTGVPSGAAVTIDVVFTTDDLFDFIEGEPLVISSPGLGTKTVSFPPFAFQVSAHFDFHTASANEQIQAVIQDFDGDETASVKVCSVGISLSPPNLDIATGGVNLDDDNNLLTVTGAPLNQVTYTPHLTANDGGDPHKVTTFTFPQHGNPQQVAVIAHTEDSSGIFALKASAGGSESQPVMVTVPPQQFIQVLYGEAVTQGRNAKDAIASVIRNRLHNLDFRPSDIYNGPNGLFTTKQFNSVGGFPFNLASSRSTPGLNTSDYDIDVSVAAAKFNGMLQDITGGCVFFVSPTASQYALVLKALRDGVKTIPPEIAKAPVLKALVGFGGPSVWQIVILNSVEPSTIPANKAAPAFIFSRPKSQSDPAVVRM